MTLELPDATTRVLREPHRQKGGSHYVRIGRAFRAASFGCRAGWTGLAADFSAAGIIQRGGQLLPGNDGARAQFMRRNHPV